MKGCRVVRTLFRSSVCVVTFFMYQQVRTVDRVQIWCGMNLNGVIWYYSLKSEEKLWGEKKWHSRKDPKSVIFYNLCDSFHDEFAYLFTSSYFFFSLLFLLNFLFFLFSTFVFSFILFSAFNPFSLISFNLRRKEFLLWWSD